MQTNLRLKDNEVSEGESTNSVLFHRVLVLLRRRGSRTREGFANYLSTVKEGIVKRRLGFASRMGQRILRPAAITAMGLMVLLLSTTVFADPTPSATVTMNQLGVYLTTLTDLYTSGSVSSSVSSVALVDTFGSATFQGYANGGISPSIAIYGTAVSVTGGGSDRWQSVGSVTSTYYYEVTSSLSQTVPVTFSFSGGGSAAASGSAWTDYGGSVLIQENNQSLAGNFRGGNMPGISPSGGPFSQTVSGAILTNTWYTVSMSVDENALANTCILAGGYYGSGTATASAWIDPTTITVDPTWLANNPGSELTFATVDPVPIPGAMLLFAPALAGLAIMRRKLKG